MKILTFSTLFPNAERPHLGIFVETRLRHLLATGQVESRVIAPIPWFPLSHPRFGEYASFARVPKHEMRFDIDVSHPRYPLIPKIGMTFAPYLLAKFVKPVIRRMINEGYDFDLIDAHYFYPDGVAAVMLGRYFQKPVVITARGSDITLIPEHTLPRKMIQWAAKHAAGIITVCNALKTELVKLGVNEEKITSLRNGVDLKRFQPIDREAMREELKLKKYSLLSCGYLIPRKGHDIIISALPLIKDVQLFIAGTGPEKNKLEALANDLNVRDRVTFLGVLPQETLKKYYGAVDALVLASSREGWANVLLESMACGTPVVASNVWGTPEVVASTEAGVLMQERTPQGIANALRTLRERNIDRTATRRYAEGFSWDETSIGQIQLFQSILTTAKNTQVLNKAKLGEGSTP